MRTLRPSCEAKSFSPCRTGDTKPETSPDEEPVAEASAEAAVDSSEEVLDGERASGLGDEIEADEERA